MAGRADYAREWMRDGDRLLQRAQELLRASRSEPTATHIDMATRDYSLAAQMYLTGAVEYQQGSDTGLRVSGRVADAVSLAQQLDGHLRREAEAALETARERPIPPQAQSRSAGLETARAFAESLRERFAHAAPELFERLSGPSHDHPSRSPSRGRE